MKIERITAVAAVKRIKALTGITPILCTTTFTAETAEHQVLVCGGYPGGLLAAAVYDRDGEIVDRFNIV